MKQSFLTEMTGEDRPSAYAANVRMAKIEGDRERELLGEADPEHYPPAHPDSFGETMAPRDPWQRPGPKRHPNSWIALLAMQYRLAVKQRQEEENRLNVE